LSVVLRIGSAFGFASDVQRMLGNAVPSLIAEVLAREIRRQLLGDKKALVSIPIIPVRGRVAPRPRGERAPATGKNRCRYLRRFARLRPIYDRLGAPASFRIVEH
jgi:hypothetical protein